MEKAEIRMIKSSYKQLVALLILVGVGLALLLVINRLSNASFNYQTQIANQSNLISQINQLLVEHQPNTEQEVLAILQEINNIKLIKNWQLIDSHDVILTQRLNETSGTIQEHKLYFKDAGGNVFVLKIYFHPINNVKGFESGQILVLTSLILIVFIYGFKHFQEIYLLEKQAFNIIAQPQKNQIIDEKTGSNLIHRAFNQLITNNNLLLDDKCELAEQIKKNSYVDDITGLGNHLFFKAEFQVRLHNHEELELGIFMLLGFSALEKEASLVLDDTTLKKIADVLKQFTTEINNGLVAKLKNNDFAILLPNQTRRNTDKLCKELIRRLALTLFGSTNTKYNFIDIGISAYKQGFDYYNVLAEADMALRNAQLQGDNNWFMYGETLDHSKVRGNIKWRTFLQAILDKQKIQLFGQKIIYLLDHDIHHQEIFVRIPDKDEILAAETFLPMAHRCGLAVEFDRQIIDGIVKHCLSCHSGSKVLFYSINLFISSLLDEKFVAWLVNKLSNYPQICQHLCFEIKETDINQHYSSLIKIFNTVAELGVSWSAKRFGAPNEDPSYLDRLPISFVKIDRRVIHNVHENHDQQLLLNSLLINLKHKSIKVIADGVENKLDADYLAKCNIHAMQGYYFDKPKRLKRLEDYLKVV